MLLKKIQSKIQGKLSKLLLNFPWTFQIYNLFFHSYYSEKKSVFKGMYKYQSDLNKNKNAIYCLRRNLHRIEKGLTHEIPKSTFALNYIEETINALEIEYNRGADQHTLNWARNVLSLFFEKVNMDNKLVLSSKKRFDNVYNNSSDKTYYSHVVFKNRTELPDVEFVKQLFESRKSIRWFSQKKVDRNIIYEVAELASLAPSACNRQPIKIHVYDDPETIRRISSLPVGSTTFHDNVPVFILFIGSLNAYYSEKDRHTIYVDGGLLAMNFMLGLEAYGLASCPINWPDLKVQNKQLAKIIGLADYEKCVMCLAVGYPKENQLIPFSTRKPIEELVEFNRFSEKYS